jgi:hypothetical protein
VLFRSIVLEKGKITGMGTHAELMETCSEYREIAESQLSEPAAESDHYKWSDEGSPQAESAP